MHLATVITTIQPPTDSVRRLVAKVNDLIVIGDAKGPDKYPASCSHLYTLDQQRQLPLSLAKELPVNHYSRKNLGYLIAMQERAECIYETDDDNAPNDDWTPRQYKVLADLACNNGWCNVYKHFAEGMLIWPRGLPLSQIESVPLIRPEFLVGSSIQQGLADGNPDVDAVWRFGNTDPWLFDENSSLALNQGCWCPFNSQSTWWWSNAYVLMYLPSFCSFRMTDIWRSFVAQRCLWEIGEAVTFHQSEVHQERNVHDLARDFHDEIPGHLHNDRIRQVLEGLTLTTNLSDSLYCCYAALVAEKILPHDELHLLRCWIDDYEKVTR